MERIFIFGSISQSKPAGDDGFDLSGDTNKGLCLWYILSSSTLKHRFISQSTPWFQCKQERSNVLIMRTSTKSNTTPVWSIVVATAATWSRLFFTSHPESPPREEIKAQNGTKARKNAGKYSPSCEKIQGVSNFDFLATGGKRGD